MAELRELDISKNRSITAAFSKIEQTPGKLPKLYDNRFLNPDRPINVGHLLDVEIKKGRFDRELKHLILDTMKTRDRLWKTQYEYMCYCCGRHLYFFDFESVDELCLTCQGEGAFGYEEMINDFSRYVDRPLRNRVERRNMFLNALNRVNRLSFDRPREPLTSRSIRII